VGKVSTLIAILSAMGQDCTDDFNEVHSQAAKRMLPSFQVGVLDHPNRAGKRRTTFRTWEQLEAAGVV
jgi:cytochrome b involved in lipid metabolism